MVLLVIIGIIPCFIIEKVIVSSYENRAVELRKINVKNQCDILGNQLMKEGYLDYQQSEIINGELSLLSTVYNGRILIINRSGRIVKDTYDIDEGKYMISEEVIQCFDGVDTSYYDQGNDYIEQTVPLKYPKNKQVAGVMLVSTSTGEIRDSIEILEHRVPLKYPKNKQVAGVMLVSTSTGEIRDSIEILEHRGNLLMLAISVLVLLLGFVLSKSLVKPFGRVSKAIEELTDGYLDEEISGNLLMLAISVLVLLLGFVLSKSLVKPFGRVSKAIEELTDGYLDEEISVPDYTETQVLSSVFNKMLKRMKVLDDSRQEFVANVSHELKTPMTSINVLADSLVGQENVPVELYQEFMQDITVEIDRENKIITDLLSLVKMDKKASELNIEKVNINELMESILKRLKPIADKKKVELVLETYRPIVAEVDAVKLSLALSNLVENGIKYNVEDGWVHVTLNADHKYFYVSVADSGVGIPEESIDRIFERFYRVDKSHSREIGGTGLGLAITRNAIAMHRGAVKVKSEEQKGTTFSVRVPLNYIA